MSGAAGAHILLVDDDARLRVLMQRYLVENGFRVTVAESAAAARETLRVVDPDMMVLDVMMPEETGLDFVESLRADRAPDLPILLLTARGAPEDRIAGFEAGADDYLGKPFDPRELLLRIRAMLRRAAPPAQQAGPVRLGAASFDPARGELTTLRGPVRLTGGEASLLAVLAARAHEVLSREALAEILGMDEAGERAIDVQVTRLRRKIEPDPREPRYLQTVRGRGYVLKPGP
ncbi:MULTISPECIES: response regulator [unclassified Acidiphilium]|uniref:response regulator n=1 Tax=unclassified Acidiphilium TaxID=2617493 RepID=UPI000BD3A710|nr:MULTISPECIES: response regulator transcription factor [unclassified Acidiphilium]OYV57330.1 MAG: DNA-binding response regulator [Acidiphilium sp. 20-67-58]HQT60487.1 response regulator transcription factor [Acidiphilium sp.]